MEIHTALEQDEVLNHFRHGRIATFVAGPLTQTPNGRWGGTWPVSYTHLDVYKRQDYKRRKALEIASGADYCHR